MESGLMQDRYLIFSLIAGFGVKLMKESNFAFFVRLFKIVLKILTFLLLEKKKKHQKAGLL